MDRGQKMQRRAGASDRDTRLDALRGIAVLLMTEQHLGIWLVDLKRYAGELGPLVYLNMLGGLAAPLFILLAGVGAAYASATLSFRASLSRGIRLLLIGLALNLLTPGWFSASSFYVLHLLGVWLILSPLLRKIDLTGLCALTLSILIASVLGQIWLKTPPQLTNPTMSGRTGAGFLRLALFEGHFPLFPWLAAAVLGLLAGRLYQAGQKGLLLGLGLSCLGFALCASLPGLLLGRAARLLPWRAISSFEFYPASPALILGLSGIGIVLLRVSSSLSSPSGTHLLVLFGRSSLTLLVVHVVLFRELFGRWGVDHRLTPTMTLVTIGATWLLWWLWARIWARSNFRFGLEWFLRAQRRQSAPE